MHERTPNPVAYKKSQRFQQVFCDVHGGDLSLLLPTPAYTLISLTFNARQRESNLSRDPFSLHHTWTIRLDKLGIRHISYIPSILLDFYRVRKNLFPFAQVLIPTYNLYWPPLTELHKAFCNPVLASASLKHSLFLLWISGWAGLARRARDFYTSHRVIRPRFLLGCVRFFLPAVKPAGLVEADSSFLIFFES